MDLLSCFYVRTRSILIPTLRYMFKLLSPFSAPVLLLILFHCYSISSSNDLEAPLLFFSPSDAVRRRSKLLLFIN